jgi:transposase
LVIHKLSAELDTITSEMAELCEEYGGDEGVLKDVSSRTDAELAYTHAIVALWNDEDKPACAAHSALIDAADGYAAHLRTLSDKYHCSALKNPKGKLALKTAKDRLAQLSNGEEYDTLAEYVSIDRKQKDSAKRANELFAAVESSFVERLTAPAADGAEGDLVIQPAAGMRVYLACQPVDLRKGFDGLSAQVVNVLADDPFSGYLFVFRGKRGDYVKLLWWDGSGLCLFAKRLEKGRFVWPPIVDGRLQLTPAQLALLIEGIDWRRTVAPDPARRPARV